MRQLWELRRKTQWLPFGLSRTFHHYFKLCVFTSELIHTEISVSRGAVFRPVTWWGELPAKHSFFRSVAICVCVVVFEQLFGQIIAFIYFNEYLLIFKKWKVVF